MKKEEHIGALLGIPQEEMALLLQVNRVHWALFVSGTGTAAERSGVEKTVVA